MSECYETSLSALIDGELDPPTRMRVTAHVKSCAHCAAELEALREVADFAAGAEFDEIRDDELSRAHFRIDELVDRSMHDLDDRPILRIGGWIALVAASLLVVCGTWLAVLPREKPAVAKTPSPAPEWEQVAMSLRVDPLPTATDATTTQFADARFADWMIDGLGFPANGEHR